MNTIKLSIITALLAFMLVGCSMFTGQIRVPEGCENSIIVNQIPDYRKVGLMFNLANVVAIKKNCYTKAQALKALDEMEALLNAGVSYVNFAACVMKKVDWVNENAGAEVFILSEYVGLFNQDVLLDACDRDLLLKHIQKQKMHINMIR